MYKTFTSNANHNGTKAWHDKGMEWRGMTKAWSGMSDKLLQHQITETGKIKKKAPDGSETGT